MAWQDEFLPSGTEVDVFDTDNKKIGTGRLVSDYNPDAEDWAVPEILMEDGSTVLGCDCWWVPTSATKEVHDKYGIQEYTVNVGVKGYEDLSLNVTVLAKDPDDALTKACAQEQRYQDDDPYLLLVKVGEGSSVFCTYPSLQDGLRHVKTVVGGRWYLVERDAKDEGAVIKSWAE